MKYHKRGLLLCGGLMLSLPAILITNAVKSGDEVGINSSFNLSKQQLNKSQIDWDSISKYCRVLFKESRT